MCSTYTWKNTPKVSRLLSRLKGSPLVRLMRCVRCDGCEKGGGMLIGYRCTVMKLEGFAGLYS